ncbi:MAG: NAD(P)-dependent oxidoreductase [Thermodesulfobacteriota bacterium]
MTKRISFLGMGIMGRAMAPHILEAGYEITVYNRNLEKTREIASKGAHVAATAEDAAGFGDVIICMVTGPEALEGIIFGEHGLSCADLQGKIIVNMSSVAPAYNLQLASRLKDSGAVFVEAPVSGSKKPAEEGKLVILAGGEDKVLEELEPLFLTMGKKVIRCGSVGQGAMMKMAINILLGTFIEGLAEMLNFGEKGGLSRDKLLDVVLAGPLSCDLFRMKEEMLRNEEYPVQFPLKHMAKDLKFAVDTAFENGSSMPTAHTIMQFYRRAVELGFGDDDFSAVGEALR